MEFKGKRAELYNNLQWANEQSFIDAVVEAGRFRSTDTVLDVGTGTGIIARAISPLVGQITGLDTSSEMLEIANFSGNIAALVGDIRKSGLPGDVFDKIVARQVFHHICEDTLQAVTECYRLTKIGGLMIIAEGVPPSWEIKSHYIKVFSLKEKRVVFMEADLEGLLSAGGYSIVKTISIWQRQISMRNWLCNSGLSTKKQSEIYNLYPKYRQLCEKAYNMTMTADDCLIDMKQAIVVGLKY